LLRCDCTDAYDGDEGMALKVKGKRQRSKVR
jgi:hypothetical protein